MFSATFVGRTRLKISGDALQWTYKMAATVFKTTGREMMDGILTDLAKTSACTLTTWAEVGITDGKGLTDAKKSSVGEDRLFE